MAEMHRNELAIMAQLADQVQVILLAHRELLARIPPRPEPPPFPQQPLRPIPPGRATRSRPTVPVAATSIELQPVAGCGPQPKAA